MEKRDPLYREIADHMVETNHRSAKAVCDEITRFLHGIEA